MAPTNLKKAQKAEADALENLGLLRDQAKMFLEDANRLNHSERIPRHYILKLQLASQQYETSVKALIAVLEDENQIRPSSMLYNVKTVTKTHLCMLYMYLINMHQV